MPLFDSGGGLVSSSRHSLIIPRRACRLGLGGVGGGSVPYQVERTPQLLGVHFYATSIERLAERRTTREKKSSFVRGSGRSELASAPT